MRLVSSFVVLACLSVVAVAAQSPAGWKVRADRSTSATDPDGAGTIKFTTAGKGFHAVNPQAAVYWNPANTAKGTYTLKGTFTLNRPSGHNNYYVWGPRGHDGSVMVVIGGNRKKMEGQSRSVTLAGRTNAPYAMPYETNLPIYVVRGAKTPLPVLWPSLKHFE